MRYEANTHAVSCSWWRLILIFVLALYAALGIAAAAVNYGLVSFHYPAHWIEDEELKDFETFLGELVSTSHDDNMKAVLRIPIVFHETRYRLDRAVDTVLKSDLTGEEWQEKIVKDTRAISHLFRDAAEEMFDFLIRGRTMMKYMKDLGLPSIGKAFQAGDYSTVLQVLEDMEKHIKDVDATMIAAKGKMRDCNELSDNVLESMKKKIPVLYKDAKEAGQGWSMQGKVAMYGLAMVLTAATAGAAPLIGVGVGLAAAGGATVGGGAAAMKHWIDIADGEDLKTRLQSNAHNLEGAYDHMDVVRDNFEQVSMDIRKLVLAVDDAEQSVSGLYGQLNPKKANLFYFRLKDLAHRCTELYALYDRGIADYHKQDWRKHQDQQDQQA